MNNFPETTTLLNKLVTLFPKNDYPVEIVFREKSDYSSTFPTEIIRCRLQSGKDVEMFCKYHTEIDKNHHGHKNGVEFENKVYSEILNQTPLPKVHCYGLCRFGDGQKMLALQYLGRDLWISHSLNPDVLSLSAEWIGKFHKSNEQNDPGFIINYDRQYYTIWSNRFYEWVKSRPEKFLAELVLMYDDNIHVLSEIERTVIHGEYYPKNILIDNDVIYPIDWESVAFAAGEIDLASLIQRWEKPYYDNAKNAYIKARWNEKSIDTAAFEKRLLLAHIYFIFCWWEEDYFNVEGDFVPDSLREMNEYYERGLKIFK